MIKDYFLNEIETAIEKAIKDNKLGQMSEYTRGTLSTERPKNADFGDFAINVSSLARNARIAPPMIANAILEYVEKDDNEYTVVAGFINFKAGKKLLVNAIDEIFKKDKSYGKPENVKTEKILLEYISANPTGPFHIGHGRWAAMGSVLANLLQFYGHEVYQEFYINDAGSQINKLGNSLAIRIRQQLGEDVDFPTDETERKNYYPGDYLIPVAKKYLETHKGLPDDVKELSDFAKKEMEDLQKALLDNFKVHFDNFYSELTLHNSGKVEKCVQTGLNHLITATIRIE
ncbi:MAG: arginine--tRNA ligase [Brachyspira sp.]|nr:arginine--tRNA ligase [Brachyspira sp.]